MTDINLTLLGFEPSTSITIFSYFLLFYKLYAKTLN